MNFNGGIADRGSENPYSKVIAEWEKRLESIGEKMEDESINQREKMRLLTWACEPISNMQCPDESFFQEKHFVEESVCYKIWFNA